METEKEVFAKTPPHGHENVGADMQTKTTDEKDFFAALDYAGYPALADVKTAVDEGDSATAKKRLLQYFKRRSIEGNISGFGVSKADENYNMAVLPMRNILTGPYEFDMWQGEFKVNAGADYTFYRVDVTDRIIREMPNGAAAFMLFAGSKQTDTVYVQSKESAKGGAPYLEIAFDNDTGRHTVKIAVSEDTYISSENGKTSVSYGDVSKLPIKEGGVGGDPTGAESTRVYMIFPLDLPSNAQIKHAELVVSAVCKGCADVLVLNVGDTVWSADTLTWKNTRGSIYSYENTDVPVWNAPAPNADSEYHNVTARFWFGKPMLYEYLSYLESPTEYNAAHPYCDVYSGGDFGPKLIDLMSAFAVQMKCGYPRTLETGERLNRWVDIVDALLKTTAFDGREDDFYRIIAFMYGDCKYINSLDITDGKVWWSNWRIVANAGFFKTAEYLRELCMHDSFRKKAEYNVEYTMDLLYNSDMSFTEAGPSYAQWCAQLFGDCAVMAEKAGKPMSGSFIEKLKGAARYAANAFYPDGFDSNVGDSNYRDKMPNFKALADFLKDPMLAAYVSGSDEYKKNLSILYPESNSAYMRTGWNPQKNIYVSFANHPGEGHAHPDANQVLMYAYGQPLLVDSGRYSYSTTNKIYDELRTAKAHNTISAQDSKLGLHTGADGFSVWRDNGLFVFAGSVQNGCTAVHTRNVLFFKRTDMPTLVTDYISGEGECTYSQNWHFMPSSNARLIGNTAVTFFYRKANIAVANCDSDARAELLDGYFSADYGVVAKSKYVSFEKNGAQVKFSTVLKPLSSGEVLDVTARDSARGENESAVYFTDGTNAVSFYVRNADMAGGEFGEYKTDARAAFVKDGKTQLLYGLADGSEIISKDRVYIKAAKTVVSLGVEIDGAAVKIFGEKLVRDSNRATAIKLYAPNSECVLFNGVRTEFVRDGEYIYAVGTKSD